MESPKESLEESIFKTLSNQTRRDILRVTGEQRQVSFTYIKNSLKIEDSASLSYHLSSLQLLIIQKNGKYALSDLGQDAYALISKTAAFTESNSTVNFMRSRIPWVIVVNAALWATALILTNVFAKSGADPLYNVIIFVALWYISNLILTRLLRRIGGKPCLSF